MKSGCEICSETLGTGASPEPQRGCRPAPRCQWLDPACGRRVGEGVGVVVLLKADRVLDIYIYIPWLSAEFDVRARLFRCGREMEQ